MIANDSALVDLAKRISWFATRDAAGETPGLGAAEGGTLTAAWLLGGVRAWFDEDEADEFVVMVRDTLAREEEMAS
jgi:hypothetical protein